MSQSTSANGRHENASTPGMGAGASPGAAPPGPGVAPGEAGGKSAGPAGEPPNSVAGIVVGRQDFAGRQITEVFAKFSDFAIYLGGSEVHVQFSDDPAIARAQSEKIALLQPSRQKLEYLASDESSGTGGQLGGGHSRQIAAALRLGLLDQTVLANAVLEDAIQNATEERLRRSRISFIPAATLMALPIAAVLFASTLLGSDRDVPFAMGGGALGAYLSMAIGIRTRALSPENSAAANYVDSGLRVAIGILSGAALVLLVTSGLVNINALTDSDTGTTTFLSNWRLAAILGFAAGFLERLLPDLLSKHFPDAPSAPSKDPLKVDIEKAAASVQAEQELKKAASEDARSKPRSGVGERGGETPAPGHVANENAAATGGGDAIGAKGEQKNAADSESKSPGT